jgi:Zn-dependent protease
MTFAIVLIGWIITLSFHEFSHALVAYYGGDTTVKEKGYLTFNPLKYTHPVYSLLFPVLFLLMGGIGLPGGAVYIETWRLRSRQWQSAVSIAGPIANLIVAFLLGLVFKLTTVGQTSFGPGLAFLALLQVTAALFNLIPVPPFDGFGALRPQLPESIRSRMDAISGVSVWLVLAAFWYLPWVGSFFWMGVGIVARFLGVPLELALVGQNDFRFWQ